MASIDNGETLQQIPSIDEAVKIVFGGKEVVVEPDQTPLVITVIRKGYQSEPFSPYQTINS